MEGKIAAVKWCRTTRKPFLGICLGLQAAVIEYTRWIDLYPSPVSEEYSQNINSVVQMIIIVIEELIFFFLLED